MGTEDSFASLRGGVGDCRVTSFQTVVLKAPQNCRSIGDLLVQTVQASQSRRQLVYRHIINMLRCGIRSELVMLSVIWSSCYACCWLRVLVSWVDLSTRVWRSSICRLKFYQIYQTLISVDYQEDLTVTIAWPRSDIAACASVDDKEVPSRLVDRGGPAEANVSLMWHRGEVNGSIRW
jgi:hypothetical protein